MSHPRTYFQTDLKSNTVIELDGDRAHYLVNVLRLKPNSSVTLFNGEGSEFRCTVQRVSRKTLTLRVGQAVVPATESPLETWLIQSIVRGERMDYCVQKATELGVSKIIPVFTQRNTVKLDAERSSKRKQHWQKIADSSTEQCGRVIVPEIKTPRSFDYLLKNNIPDTATLIAMDPADGISSLEQVSHNIQHPVLLFVGPEGGFDEDEIYLLKQLGATSLKLGNRVLRSETAGIIGLAALQMQWGDF